MKTQALTNPVVVVGTGRCGSTLISSILRLHQAVLSLSEFFVSLSPSAFPSHPVDAASFWSILSTPRLKPIVMMRNGLTIDEFLYRPGPHTRFNTETGIPAICLTTLPHLTDDPDGLYEEIEVFVQAMRTNIVGEQYRQLFEWLKRRFGRTIWVERSGGSLRFVADLLTTFPEAQFVHIARDGRECALSMSRHHAFRLAVITAELRRWLGVDPYHSPVRPEGVKLPPDLDALCPERFDVDVYHNYTIPIEHFGVLWSTQMITGLRHLARVVPHRVLTIRYEDLIASPREELRRLQEFVGFDADEAWLDRASGLVRRNPLHWPELPEPDRARLELACRTGLRLLSESTRVVRPALTDSPVAVGG
ncbi:MAG: sulfotransferase [Chloroflexi bacterium]|nr:MAG: sulfotransferase [Chloroflexota bacterium]